MLCILKAIVAWVLMLVVGTNLIGFFMRGVFWSPPHVDAPTERLQKLLIREFSRMSFANVTITLGSLVAIGAYLFVLNYFWNYGLALAGGMVMLSRIPDLILEIQTGKKPTNSTELPKGPVYFFCDGNFVGSPCFSLVFTLQVATRLARNLRR